MPIARSAHKPNRSSKAAWLGAVLLVCSVATLLAVAWRKTTAEWDANRSVLAAEARDFAARTARSIDPALRDLEPGDLVGIAFPGAGASGLQAWTDALFAIRDGQLARPPELGHESTAAAAATYERDELGVVDREEVARAYEAPLAERAARLLRLGERTSLPVAVVANAAVDAGWCAERNGRGEQLRQAVLRARSLLSQLAPGSLQSDSLAVSASLLAVRNALKPMASWQDALVRLPSALSTGTLTILAEQDGVSKAFVDELQLRVQRIVERRRRFEHGRAFVAAGERSTDPESGPRRAGAYVALPIGSAPDVHLLIVTEAELATLAAHRIGQTVVVADAAAGEPLAEQVAANGLLCVEAPNWQLEESGSAERLVLVGLLLSIALGAGLAWRSSRVEIRAARREAEFLTLVTHELKTPLTGIRVVAELLADGRVTDAEESRRWLKRLDGEATRLGMLVDNVLDLGRTERGEIVHRPEPADLAELCREVCSMFEPIAVQNGMELHLDISEQAERSPAVTVDRDATKQALLNLCDNARKYGKDGRVIEVRVDRQQGAIRCEVRDHGPGIAAGERDAIFGRFQRGATHRHGQIPGAGLGLHLARGIVQRDGGTLVAVEPGDGTGALFRIVWPLPEQPTNTIS